MQTKQDLNKSTIFKCINSQLEIWPSTEYIDNNKQINAKFIEDIFMYLLEVN